MITTLSQVEIDDCDGGSTAKSASVTAHHEERRDNDAPRTANAAATAHRTADRNASGTAHRLERSGNGAPRRAQQQRRTADRNASGTAQRLERSGNGAPRTAKSATATAHRGPERVT